MIAVYCDMQFWLLLSGKCMSRLSAGLRWLCSSAQRSEAHVLFAPGLLQVCICQYEAVAPSLTVTLQPEKPRQARYESKHFRSAVGLAADA